MIVHCLLQPCAAHATRFGRLGIRARQVGTTDAVCTTCHDCRRFATPWGSLRASVARAGGRIAHCRCLEELFEKHKANYGIAPETHLEIAGFDWLSRLIDRFVLCWLSLIWFEPTNTLDWLCHYSWSIMYTSTMCIIFNYLFDRCFQFTSSNCYMLFIQYFSPKFLNKTPPRTKGVACVR